MFDIRNVFGKVFHANHFIENNHQSLWFLLITRNINGQFSEHRQTLT
jgi:hypothetical protein